LSENRGGGLTHTVYTDSV